MGKRLAIMMVLVAMTPTVRLNIFSNSRLLIGVKNNIPWDVVMPSAIYDDIPRTDTNIGKLQKITLFFPVLPKIEVKNPSLICRDSALY